MTTITSSITKETKHDHNAKSNNRNKSELSHHARMVKDYRSEGGPCLEYLPLNENTNGIKVSGQSLYLGGEEGLNGTIYCIPGHATRVLAIRTSPNQIMNSTSSNTSASTTATSTTTMTTHNDRLEFIGPILEGKFKWLRGVRVGHVIYGLPCHANTVLRIDTRTDTVSLLPIPYATFYNNQDGHDYGPDIALQQETMTWKYHGGTSTTTTTTTTRNTKNVNKQDAATTTTTTTTTTTIYCIPQSAWHVLKIENDVCSFVPSEPLLGRFKWYGGVLGKTDGAIYGIPHNASTVLRISKHGIVSLHPWASTTNKTKDSTMEEHKDTTGMKNRTDPDQNTLGGHKWHGGTTSVNGNTIVCVPANADTILFIEPPTTEKGVNDYLQHQLHEEPRFYQLQSPHILTGRHRTDGKYKYLGATGSSGRDKDCPNENDNVYCFPSGAEHVLKVNASLGTIEAIGPNLVAMERMVQNKWQNGILCHDNNIYAIPLSAETVLRINTHTQEVTTWKLPMPCSGLAKWEGGLLAQSNGVMYCMPNNFKAVLRISV